MSNEYDFFDMGVRRANEGLINLKMMAKEIGEKYGLDAKLQFEAGIAMTIPAYSKISQVDVSQKEIVNGATTNMGVPNLRNNSYFGGHGTSHQYKKITDEVSVYNDPQGKRR